ncbi:hypothetical protein RY831_31270 [Noviherbaspirillum sp. CPCC 100848]|uniref:RES domain-containing protein n=1 Tax=Noviherbaspirillum album TaxID=3080276 RepID=A0ABU6JIU5_9BURK|nr:hypothetical protein [Noviherbaspirillum sp. CPCC 100848]MEC4723617.1 hypothetical protein [Noviherbaspirillum sp. CPCC 100848]
MNPLQSLSLAGSYARPSKLYRYSQRQWLERSLTQGEFRLCPPASTAYAMAGSDQIMPFGPKPAAMPTGFLTLSMASAWDDFLFDAFGGADCCLVIHDVEAFGERVHRAAQRVLPSWAGIDAAISYGKPSPLGAVFSKARQLAAEKEWLFAWRPTQRTLSGNPVVIRLGSIEGIAELRERSKDPAP